MTVDISRLRELLDKATPGPWEAVAAGQADDLNEVVAQNGYKIIADAEGPDAALIAESHNALPDLLDALAARDVEIARLRSLAGRYTNHVGECEGTDFLDFEELSFRDNGWLSRDDSAELKALDRAAAEAGPPHLTEDEDTP